ncbi:MAG TPA: acyltransferase [Bacteroidia bacterium]|nr:acyltransferase [Bacteroidia bacterium]
MPFKIYTACKIKIRQGAAIKLDGRLTIGNPNREKPVISRLPSNLFFGEQSTVIIGHSVSIGPGVNIIVKDRAQLSIGSNTYFTSDSHIEIVNNVEIGSNCAISWGVTIIDDNHHQVLPATGEQKKQVKIKDHVWIGCNVTILAGSEVGKNCIVAAGSIVKGLFPDNVMIAGNPAKIVKQDINWE